MKKGLTIVITGNGKGKTTAAFGLALRSAGHGMKVCIVQFMKGKIPSGEIKAIAKISPDVDLYISGTGFFEITGDVHTKEEHKKSAQKALAYAKKKIQTCLFDMIILDEINIAIKLGLLELNDVVRIIKDKPFPLHLVMTGRDAPRDIIELADTVTEMKEIKHPYTEGSSPVRGIDF